MHERLLPVRSTSPSLPISLKKKKKRRVVCHATQRSYKSNPSHLGYLIFSLPSPRKPTTNKNQQEKTPPTHHNICNEKKKRKKNREEQRIHINSKDHSTHPSTRPEKHTPLLYPAPSLCSPPTPPSCHLTAVLTLTLLGLSGLPTPPAASLPPSTSFFATLSG